MHFGIVVLVATLSVVAAAEASHQSTVPKSFKVANKLSNEVKAKIPLTHELVEKIEKAKRSSKYVTHDRKEMNQDNKKEEEMKVKKNDNLRGVNQSKNHVLKGIAHLEARRDISKVTRVHGKEYHYVMFSLKKRNMDKVKNIALEVSDPRSPKYGKHMSKTEVSELTKNPAALDAVKEYLESFDSSIIIDDITVNGDYVHVRAPVEVWEKMFNTEFNHYKITHHDKSVEHFIRTEKYFLPVEIASHINGVFATTDMPLPKKKIHMSSEADKKVINDKIRASAYDPTMLSTLEFVYPDVINTVYNVDSNIGSNSVSQAIYASIGQEYSTVDLKNFLSYFSIPSDSVDYVTSHQTKYCPDGNDCAESNLDVQYMMGISQQTPMTYYYTNKWWSWLSVVANMTNPPDLFSISYGAEEFEMSSTELDTFDEEAAILATMGITLLAASGDDGAPGTLTEDAITCQYSPEWPASSQYVTAVGATQGPEANKTEVACSGATNGIITTGGGFSNYFETPTFQKSFVDAYLSNNSPYQGFNRNGRGYPDVAIMGRNYLIALSSTELYPVYTGLFGTSASSPTFGALVSLVNNARVSAGKSKIGWLNPALYYLKSNDNTNSIFNDITAGNNNCIVYGEICCQQGFDAVTGWDPATGLGSIDFVNFKAAMLALGDMADDDTATTLDVPTVAPTTYTASNKPTSSPTGAPGFVSFSTFNLNDADCNSAPPMSTAHTQGVCIPLYNGNGEIVASGQWTCSANGELIESIYANTDCSGTAESDLSNIFYEGCNFQADLSAYYGGGSYYGGYYYSSSSSSSSSSAIYYDDDWDAQYYYANMPNMTYGADDVGYNFNYTPYSLSCSNSGLTDSGYDLPSGTVYTMYRTYASVDKSCEASDISGYDAYSNDACIYYDTYGFYELYIQFNGLSVKFYVDDSCSTYAGSDGSEITLGSYCGSVFDDDYGGYYYGVSDAVNYNWFVYPTMVGAPTMQPSDAPGSNSNSKSKSSGGLSEGGKAAIGVVFGLLGFAGIAFGFYWYNKKNKDASLLQSALNSSGNR